MGEAQNSEMEVRKEEGVMELAGWLQEGYKATWGEEWMGIGGREG